MKVVRNASLLLLSFVVQCAGCHMWACLTSESLFGSFLQTLSSGGICCARYLSADHHEVGFLGTTVLMFTCYQLLCRPRGRCVSIMVAVLSPHSKKIWRRLTVWIGFPWLHNTKTGTSKVCTLFHLSIKDEQTVLSSILLVEALSAWIGSAGRCLCTWRIKRDVGSWRSCHKLYRSGG